jgi:hypothetical protein
MLCNPFAAYHAVQGRMKDTLHEAERSRLIAAARRPGKAQRRRWPVTSIISNLLSFAAQLQNWWIAIKRSTASGTRKKTTP